MSQLSNLMTHMDTQYMSIQVLEIVLLLTYSIVVECEENVALTAVCGATLLGTPENAIAAESVS